MIISVSLNRAVFLILKGAILIEIMGKYPDNKFAVDASKKLLHSKDNHIDYKQYMNKRNELKKKCKKKAGMQTRYHGVTHNKPFARFREVMLEHVGN